MVSAAGFKAGGVKTGSITAAWQANIGNVAADLCISIECWSSWSCCKFQGKAAVCVGVLAAAGFEADGEAAVWQEKIGNVAGVLDLVACTKAVVGVEATGVGAVATAPSMLSAAVFKAGGVKAGSIAAFGKKILAMLQLDPSLQHLPLIVHHTIRLKWNVKVITWTKIDNRGTEDQNNLDQELLYL